MVSRAGVGAVSDLLLAMMLPSEYPSVRLPTMDMPRTSVLTTRDVYNISSPTDNATGWTAGDNIICFFGQAGRTFAVYTPYPNGETYNCYFPTGAPAAGSWYFQMGALSNGSIYPDALWDPISVRGSTTTTAVHGPSLGIGYSDGAPYVFLDENDAFKITMPPGVASFGTVAGYINIQIEEYIGVGQQPTVYDDVQCTITAGAFSNTTRTVNHAGYYALRCASVIVSTGTFSTFASVGVDIVTYGSSAGRWRHFCLGDIDPQNNGDVNIGEEVRVNAATMLVTNTTSVMNAQGLVLAARVRTALPFTVTGTKIARMAEKFTDRAATGVYTFKEFTTVAEKFTSSVTGYTDNTKVGPRFDLDFDDYVHIISLSNPSVATAANAYEISVDFTLEFKTDISRYSKDTSTYSYDQLVRARKIVNSRPEWFYENPNHMRTIYNLAKTVGRKLISGAQYVAPFAAHAASAVDPVHAVGYQTLANLLARIRV